MQSFASYYDFYDGADDRQDQLRLYRELLFSAGKQVLELACGTGIVAIDLAGAGLSVTGLDIDPDMLAVARRKVSKEPSEVQARLQWVEADMTQFQLRHQFDAALLGNNEFGYLTTLEAQRSCLHAIREHLKEGGTLVIEERLYAPETLTKMMQRRSVITVHTARVSPATGLYTTFNAVVINVDVLSQIILWRRYVEEVAEDGSVRRILPKERFIKQHYFSPQEMRLLLASAGFAVEHIYGGYERQPLEAKSRSMIFECRARKGDNQ